MLHRGYAINGIKTKTILKTILRFIVLGIKLEVLKGDYAKMD